MNEGKTWLIIGVVAVVVGFLALFVFAGGDSGTKQVEINPSPPASAPSPAPAPSPTPTPSPTPSN